MSEKPKEKKIAKFSKQQDEVLTALDMLPLFYNYDKKELGKLAKMYLAIGNPRQLINFILLFEGQTIIVPKLNDIEPLLRMILVYNDLLKIDINNKEERKYYMKKAFIKYRVELTKENIKKFDELCEHIKSKYSK